MKSNYPVVTLKGYVQHVSQRNKGATDVDVYSVTNSVGFVKSADYFSKEVFSKDISNYKVVRSSQFAYNPSRINVGSVDYLRYVERALVSPLYIVFEVGNEIYPGYLFRYLKGDWGINQIRKNTEGSVRDSLKFEGLERIKIPLPPLAEQKRIAAILYKADAISRKRQAAIKLGEKFSRSLYFDMFGNEESYPITKLSEVCEFITKGTTPKSKEIYENYHANYIPFLKVYHIDEIGNVDFDHKPSFVQKETHEGLLKRSKVYPNDVIMNIVGPPLGKIAIIPNCYPEWNVNQALVIFRGTERIRPLYLFHTLRNIKILSKILSNAVGIRQLNISLQQCRNIEIPLPPLEEQVEFEKKMKVLNKSILSANHFLMFSTVLFKSLAQHSFIGEL